MSKTIKLSEISTELETILSDVVRSSFETRQQAVQAGAEVFKSAIESASPRDTGEFANSWKIKTKYKDCRYVGNTKTATKPVRRKTKKGTKGEIREGVPLSNILEYGKNSKHYGFVRKCFEDTEPQIYQAIKNTIQNGGIK